MKNALTIDLEDYYHVSAFSSSNSPDEWGSRTSRVEQNTHLLLDWLEGAGCKATFFTLAWVARQFPRLVRQVAERGHEVACHSLQHRTVYQMTAQEFREDTQEAKRLLEDASGSAVYGYRAPSFSITRKSLWALEILVQLGFRFDSSIFPVKHPNYGIPDAPRHPHRVKTGSGSIVEFPMSTLDFGGRRSPFGGGAYFRLLPYWYTRWFIDLLNRTESLPVCVYLHPWEIDPQQPRMEGDLSARIRHYIGLRSTSMKFKKLIHDFEFCPVGAFVDEVRIAETYGSAI